MAIKKLLRKTQCLDERIVKDFLMQALGIVATDIKRYVKHPGVDFTRKRKLDPFTVMLALITMDHKDSVAAAIDCFCGRKDYLFNKERPCESAYYKARCKLEADAFAAVMKEFNRLVMEDRGYQLDTTDGLVMYAIDGTKVSVPYNPDADTFSPQGEKRGYNQEHISTINGLNSRIYEDLIIKGVTCYNEPREAFEMIERTFGEGSIPRLFIMDRGYSSTNLFAHISVMKNTYFLIRLKKNWANIMKKLPQNQEYDITLEITITTSKKDLLHHPDDGTIWMYVAKAHYNHRKKSPNWDFENKFHLKLRFVSVCINPDKEDGDPNKYEYLVTNLPDCPYTTAKLKKYYSMRWGIETSYRDLKYAVDLVDFHSNDQELIRQEIYAAFIRYNFSMFIIKLAINKLAKKLRGKYEYSPRRATAFDMCQQYLKEAWIKSPEGGRLIPRMLKILEPIRPDRPDRRKAVHQKPAKGFTYRNAA